MSSYTQTYYQKNKEKILEKNKLKRNEISQYNKQYFQKKRDYLSAKQFIFRRENLELVRERDRVYKRIYKNKNKEKILEAPKN